MKRAFPKSQNLVTTKINLSENEVLKKANKNLNIFKIVLIKIKIKKIILLKNYKIIVEKL